MSDLSPQCAPKRTSADTFVLVSSLRSQRCRSMSDPECAPDLTVAGLRPTSKHTATYGSLIVLASGKTCLFQRDSPTILRGFLVV